MTDDEYEQLARQLGLGSPSQLYAQASKPPDILTPDAFTAAYTAPISGKPSGLPSATDRPQAKGLTTPALEQVKAPVEPPTVDTSALDKGISQAIEYHQTRAANQQSQLTEAIKTLGDIDASDTQKQNARAAVQSIPTDQAGNVINPVPSLARIKEVYPELDDQGTKKLQRAAFVSNISPADDPSIAALKQYTNLQTGGSYRALQDLGIQFPGTTSKYATAPVFTPDAPGPPQKIQRAQLVPGQTLDASGKVVQAPASGIGLTTVRGTEFGQIDNPARGGYTEAGWNVGAWGGDIADTKSPFVALPTAVLGKYGNPNDSKFADDFNSKYDIQVTDPKTGKVVVASVRDKGPGVKTGAGIDMGWATREQLGLQPGFSGNIAYRVVPKGSALPDNTTPSVAQTEQATAAAAGGQFAPGRTASEVYIKPLDPKTIKDPSIHGASMSTGELATWARHQADEYAGAMDDAGAPLTIKQYQDQYQKFFEGGQKYADAKGEPLQPVPAEWNNQFSALAALVSPSGTGTTGVSQLDLLAQYFKSAKEKGSLGTMGWVGGASSQERKLYESQQEHLAVPISKGLMGQTGPPSNQDIENAKKVLPGEFDSDETAATKIANIKASARDQMRRIIQLAKGEHHDTAALEDMYRKLFVTSPEEQQAQQSAGFDKSTNKINANKPGAKPSPTPAPTPAPGLFQPVVDESLLRGST